ncbi:cupredoxin domain-containing protein [Yinghuangia seranimata]|uniref:cupredoxin domain-containing protein n=1 Tax=Yinghuangia seranimata TaxID=408067 RepID=UPI00248CD4E8|nr:cupredoxin domain-containing protein [Yinghuangia seranimata]MDI2130109.1 cupredoxin domain-containing protein [Yinghuangia seranimata]
MSIPTRALGPRGAVLAAMFLLFLLAGCSSSSSSGGYGGKATAASGPASHSAAQTTATSGPASHSAAQTTTVTIENFKFTPAAFSVAPGATVTVVNMDPVPHTLTANNKAFDTGTIAAGATATFTAPTAPGTYPYLCTIHTYMTGTLTVG